MGVIAPSAGPIVPSGAWLCTLCTNTGSCTSRVQEQLVIVTALPCGLHCKLSSLDGTSSARLKLCCTAALRPLIFFSLDGTSSVRLKLCCTAVHRVLIFSLDGSSSAPEVMLYRSAQASDLLPRWHQQRAPEVMLYRSAQATDLLPRWHQQRAPEVMLYRSV